MDHQALSRHRLLLVASLALLSGRLVLAQTAFSAVLERGASFVRTAYALDSIPEAPPWDVRDWQRDTARDQVVTLLDPAALPGTSPFPSADLVEHIVDSSGTIERFWRQTESELACLGQTQPQGAGIAVVPQSMRLLRLPITAGYQHQAEVTSGFSIQGLALERSGLVSVTERGRGTLLLPRGRIPGTLCLEVRQDIAQKANLSGAPDRLMTRSLVYLAPGYGYPVLTLTEELAYRGDSATSRRLALVAERTTAAAPARWIPHLAALGGNFTSQVLLRNLGDQTQTLWLTPYDQSGKVAAGRAYTLGPKAMMLVEHEALGSQSSHLAIAGGAQIAATVGYRAASGGGTAHLQAVVAGTTSRVFRGDTALLFDGLALVNLGQQAARVSVALLDDQGTQVGTSVLAEALAPGAKLLTDLGQAFGEQSGRLFLVTSEQPAAMLFLRGSRDGRYLYPNNPLLPGVQERRWLPHMSAYGGDFTSEVWLHNATANDAQLTLTPFAQGQALAPTTLKVAAQHTLIVNHEQLGTQAEAVLVEGAVGCIASTAYRARAGGAAAQVAETLMGREWQAWPGEAQLLWDGMAAVNTTAASARFRAELLDEDGVVLASQEAPIGCQGKLLWNLSQALTSAPSRVLRLYSDQEAALILLRGSLDGRHLYPNSPLSGL